MNRHSPRARRIGGNHWHQTRAIGHKGSKTARDRGEMASFIICTPKRVYTGLSRAIWRPSFRLIRETESFFERSIRVGARSNKSETHFAARRRSLRGEPMT